jgi:hypothetical protein
MQETLEIAKYTIPAIVVFITAYFLLKLHLNAQEEINKKELKTQIEELRLQIKQEDKKYLTPIRLQAYERMVLFLERISPQSLVFRVQKSSQKVFQLQSALLKAIRDEYEHNLAQQLYISKESWSVLKAAKESMVKLINTAAMDLKPDDVGIELSKKIFELSVDNENLNTGKAIEFLKKDVQNLF